MLEILRRLKETPGIKGSLAVTRDGIVIASDLAGALDEEATAAHLASVATRTHALLTAADFPDLDEMLLTATRGRIVLINLGRFYLVVATNQFIDLDMTMLEIKGAAKRLREVGTMKV